MLIPKILRAAGTDSVLCVLNPTDRFRLLKKGNQVAKAYPVLEIIANSTQEAGEIRTAQVDLEYNVYFSHESEMSEHVTFCNDPPPWAASPPPQKTWQTQFKMIFIFL